MRARVRTKDAQPKEAGKIPGLIDPSSQTASQLQAAFETFNDAASRFGDRFESLEKRVAELNLELEEANSQLRHNLEEKQKMENYLSTLLESLPIGVIGVDVKGAISSCNRQARCGRCSATVTTPCTDWLPIRAASRSASCDIE